MVYGIIGCCCIAAGCIVIGALLWSNYKLTGALIRLSLQRGYSIVEVDPRGVGKAIQIQDRVLDLESEVKQMQAPSETRSVEEFTADPPEQDYPDDGVLRNITRAPEGLSVVPNEG